MSSIYDDLSAALSGEPAQEISKRIGVSEDQAANGVKAALPMLLGALSRNAAQPGGEDAILAALDRDHDGSILDDIGGVAGGKYDGDGDAILGHMLGGNRANAESQMAQFAGMDRQSMQKLLMMLAPLILGWLAKRKGGGGGGGNGGGLGDILKREERDSRERGGGGLGDILTDILSGGAGGSAEPKSKMPGCMSLLGGLLGKGRR